MSPAAAVYEPQPQSAHELGSADSLLSDQLADTAANLVFAENLLDGPNIR